MLQIIIFSFNRALQLNTLLNSLKELWLKPDYHIDIVYNTSHDDYQKGYDKLINKYLLDKSILFHKESNIGDCYSIKDKLNIRNLVRLLRYPQIRHPKTNFRSLCISLIKNNSSEYIMFMTDDAMFIRKVELKKEIFNWIDKNPYHRQFSLRIGLGMDGQDKRIRHIGNYLYWNFFENEDLKNWGYPFSVDAHVYSKRVIVELFSKYIFTNPNTLEGYIYAQIHRKRWLEEGMANEFTSLLSFPINMVQNVSDNESLNVSCKMLNNKFLDDYTLDYPLELDIMAFQQYPKRLLFYKNNKLEEYIVKR